MSIWTTHTHTHTLFGFLFHFFVFQINFYCFHCFTASERASEQKSHSNEFSLEHLLALLRLTNHQIQFTWICARIEMKKMKIKNKMRAHSLQQIKYANEFVYRIYFSNCMTDNALFTLSLAACANIFLLGFCVVAHSVKISIGSHSLAIFTAAARLTVLRNNNNTRGEHWIRCDAMDWAIGSWNRHFLPFVLHFECQAFAIHEKRRLKLVFGGSRWPIPFNEPRFHLFIRIYVSDTSYIHHPDRPSATLTSSIRIHVNTNRTVCHVKYIQKLHIFILLLELSSNQNCVFVLFVGSR